MTACLRARLSILFVRDYRGFTGGHGKVFDYFRHAEMADFLTPSIYMTRESVLDKQNPWVAAAKAIRRTVEPSDCYFVAGSDWEILDRNRIDLSRRPVINLIQGLSHRDPADRKYRFLERKALRICVSREVADAILATGRVNGPVAAIPNGLDLDGLADVRSRAIQRECVFIGGLKNRALACRLAETLARGGVEVDLSAELVPRLEFLQRMAACRLAVLLPCEEEGFFLPALEAMALGSAVVVPDCIGNRSFCLPGNTCVMPEYTLAGIADAVLSILDDRDRRTRIAEAGRSLAQGYSLEAERERFEQCARTYLASGIPTSPEP